MLQCVAVCCSVLQCVAVYLQVSIDVSVLVSIDVFVLVSIDVSVLVSIDVSVLHERYRCTRGIFTRGNVSVPMCTIHSCPDT